MARTRDNPVKMRKTVPVAMPAERVALVTGGAGFLGRHLVQALVRSGDYTSVRVFDIRPSPDVPPADSIVGDLRDPASVAAAVEGVHVIFHCATASPAAASAADCALMTAVNVDGTRHVLDAAVEEGVQYVVFTSSASVVFDGSDLDGVDESHPYAARPLDFYTATKTEAERMVLAANGRKVAGFGGRELATIALRPSGIFGEHDALLVPTAVAKARAGKMKYIIGSGTNLMDWTYAGNVADAHVAAARALVNELPVAGRAFFVTNDDPRPFWTFMGDLLEPLGYGRPRIKLPFWPIYVVSVLIATLSALLKRVGITLPQTDFTPMRVTISAATRRLDCTAAKRDLGYVPAVSVEEGLKRTVAAFQHLAAPGAAVNKKRGGRSRSRSRGRA